MQKTRTITELVEKTGWCVHPVREKSKVPILQDWPNKASNDPDIIEAWTKQYPNCNWGILTGARSGVLVVDVDPRNDGNVSLKELEVQYGLLPHTIRVTTGGGGKHIFFRMPDGDHRWPSKLADGIDLKANGGFVVAPGSVHPDGGIYEFQEGCSPWEIELAEVPEWLQELPNKKVSPPAPAGMEQIPEGERDDRLFAESRRLASMGWAEASIYEALQIRNLAACKPPLDDSDIRRIASQGLKYNVQANNEPGTTDADNARRLVHRHGKSIRYVKSERSGSWYVYNGILWDPSPLGETLVLQKAEDTARSIANEAALEPDQKKAKALLEHAARSLNRGRFMAMVDQTKHQLEIAATPQNFNLDDYLINLNNGTYDLRKHVLREPDPEDMMTKTAGFNYSAGATASRWIQFLDEVFQGDQDLISWIQCFLGMSLTGYTGHQFVVFMTGRGSNGKSVLLEVMTKVLGDYGSKCNNVLFKSTNNDNEKGYILGTLRDIRFSYASELNEGEYLASATIKEITGGETVSAREMYQGYCPMIPKMKLSMATNSLPRIDELNDGTWRRIRVVPFEVQFKPKADAKPGDKIRDDGLKDYLIANELPGIFNWCLQGLKNLQANQMQMPACSAVETATRKYRRDEDLIAEWLDDECDLDDLLAETPGVLLGNFREYSGYKNFGTKKFKNLLESHGYRSTKSNGKRVYKGIGLKGFRI